MKQRTLYYIITAVLLMVIMSTFLIYRIYKDNMNIPNTFKESPNESPNVASRYFKGEELKAVLALENNNENEFREALKNGADINAPGEQGVVPYLYFISTNNSSAMVKLFKSGANFHYILPKEGARTLGPYFPDDLGWISGVKAKVLILKELLEAGLDPNFMPKSPKEGSWTLLFYALSTGTGTNQEAIDLLLSHGADINAQTSLGRSVLEEAINYENFSLAEYLINHGANPKIKNKYGDSAIDILKKRKEKYNGGTIVPEIDNLLEFIKIKGFEI